MVAFVGGELLEQVDLWIIDYDVWFLAHIAWSLTRTSSYRYLSHPFLATRLCSVDRVEELQLYSILTYRLD